MVSSSMRCVHLVKGILARRHPLALSRSDTSQPVFVWEPVGDLCKPEQVTMFKIAMKSVDVVSPNAEELAAFFHTDASSKTQDSIAFEVCSWGIGPKSGGHLIVREGEHGCTLYSKSWKCHLPAFFLSYDAHRVVDPTGGGNTFLGALAITLSGALTGTPSLQMAEGIVPSEPVQSLDTDELQQLVAAAAVATVAAGFAIQQYGMPVLTSGDADEELWNDCHFTERLAVYVERETENIRQSIERRQLDLDI